MEGRNHALETAQALCQMAQNLGIGLIYKTSFDKANRTSGGSPRGVGLEEALPIFAEIRETLGCPVLTDVHNAEQCARVAEVVDVLQIPAFLCRQTDLPARRCHHRTRCSRQERAVSSALGYETRDRQIDRHRQSAGLGVRTRCQFWLQHARLRFARVAVACGARLSRCLRCHAFGSAAGRGRGTRAAATAGSYPFSRKLRSRSESLRFSWRPTPTLTMRPPMAPTWSPYATCHN